MLFQGRYKAKGSCMGGQAGDGRGHLLSNQVATAAMADTSAASL